MGKNVVLILPAGRFDDNIYLKTRQILERYGHKVLAACSVKKPIFGLKGTTRVLVDCTLEEVKPEETSAIILVGGIGASEYKDSQPLFDLLQQANQLNVILAAIANTPVFLAKAGVLKGKNATVLYYDSKELIAGGANYTSASITVDGNILTAKEAAMADTFALALVKMLKEE